MKHFDVFMNDCCESKGQKDYEDLIKNTLGVANRIPSLHKCQSEKWNYKYFFQDCNIK